MRALNPRKFDLGIGAGERRNVHCEEYATKRVSCLVPAVDDHDRGGDGGFHVREPPIRAVKSLGQAFAAKVQNCTLQLKEIVLFK